MDEQVTPTESVTVTPDPVVVDTPVTEQLQAETPQSQAEPAPTSETAQIITPEPIPEILHETPTPQMAGSEPLPESIPESTQPSAEAIAEAPQQETPTLTLTPISDLGIVEETLPKAEEPAPAPTPPQTQKGTAQPEISRPPLNTNSQGRSGEVESMPAQAQVTATPPRNIARLLLEKAKLTIQLRKQKKLLKVMTLFTKKTHITNDDVEKLLHVSDATATRYLSELEKQGKIIQNGKTGRAVTYTKY